MQFITLFCGYKFITLVNVQIISLYYSCNIMQPVNKIAHTSGACPKTSRGEPSFIQSSSSHLLFFNGPTTFMMPHDQSLPTLYINHMSMVCAAKFSPSYRYIASIDQKGTLFIYQIQNQGNNQQRKKLVLYKNYEGVYIGAKAIDWTNDDKKICIVGLGKNKFGRVISVDTGTDVGQIGAVSHNLSSASFRPQKPYRLAVGGQQFIIKFYQGPPYKFISSKKTHTNYINQVLFSPSGNHIVSVGSDRKIVLYNGKDYEIIKQLQSAHNGGIMGVVWLDENTFVTCSSDKMIKKWNLNLQLISQINSTQNQQQLALVDAFVVAITFCRQKQLIFYVLLSGKIKAVNIKELANVKEYQYDGARNKILKILPLQTKQENKSNASCAFLIDSNGKILKINNKTSQTHQIITNTVQNKILLDASLSQKQGILYYLTGEQQIHEVEIQSKYDTQSKIQVKKPTKAEGTIFILAADQGLIVFSRDLIKYYKNEKGGLLKLSESKLAFQPTFVASTKKSHEGANIEVWVGSAKGNIQLFHININQNNAKIQKMHQFQANSNKITFIKLFKNLVFAGDSMGIVKVYKWDGQANKIQQAGDPMGTHTTMIRSILVSCQQNESIQSGVVYIFSMDNKFSVWKLANFARITTFNDVHKHGILCAEIVGNSIITCGGDLLVKVHSI